MNKRIFRAKLRHPSLFGQWIYWNVYGELTTSVGKRHSLQIPRKSGLSMYYTVNDIRKYIDPNTIGEYAGIRDKHKKLIFTGDILSAHYDKQHPDDETRELVEFDKDGAFRYSADRKATSQSE